MNTDDILDKCDAVLSLDDPDFIQKLRVAIGVTADEALEFFGPQFDRTDGVTAPIPQLRFAQLPSLSPETLRALGCQRWSEPDEQGNTLWLYPAEWYGYIPDGTPIVDINGEHEEFKRGETDDDMRYGVLAFGFLRSEPGSEVSK